MRNDSLHYSCLPNRNPIRSGTGGDKLSVRSSSVKRKCDRRVVGWVDNRKPKITFLW